MKPFQLCQNILFIVSANILFIACNQVDDNSVYNASLIFPNAIEIEVTPYNYTDTLSTIVYNVKGDTSLDTLNSTPEFRWKAFASSIYTVAVSKEKIETVNGSIANPEMIIWQWHSGMKQEFTENGDYQYNKICFNNGKPVEEKNILYSTQPLPLKSGLYFWGVWGWDKSGRKVVFSSKPLKFVVY
jgi:hypothetical protein